MHAYSHPYEHTYANPTPMSIFKRTYTCNPTSISTSKRVSQQILKNSKSPLTCRYLGARSLTLKWLCWLIHEINPGRDTSIGVESKASNSIQVSQKKSWSVSKNAYRERCIRGDFVNFKSSKMLIGVELGVRQYWVDNNFFSVSDKNKRIRNPMVKLSTIVTIY